LHFPSDVFDPAPTLLADTATGSLQQTRQDSPFQCMLSKMIHNFCGYVCEQPQKSVHEPAPRPEPR